MTTNGRRAGWTTVRLGDAVNEISTRIDNPSEAEVNRFVGLEHFDSGELKIRRWGTTADLISTMKLFKAGDTLFARRNAYLRRASMVDFDGVCSGDAIVLRPKESVIIGDLLPAILNTETFWEYALSHAAGSMSKRVNLRNLLSYEFALPPIEEQKRIAELLWAADDAAASVSALLDRVEKAFSAALAVKFSEHSGDSRELVRLDELCTQLPQSGIYKGEKYCGHGTKIVKMGQLFANDVIDDDVDMDRMELTDVEMQRYCLTANDLLFGRRSIVLEGAGKCTLVGDIKGQMAFESSILRISLDPMKAKSGFVFSWFKSPGGKKELCRIRSFTTVAGITGSDLRHVRVRRLSLGEQETISALSQQYRDEVAAVGLHARKTRDLMTSIREALLGGDRHVR